MNYLLLVLIVFASLGVVNGLLIGTYLIFKKQRILSDIYFGALLLALSIRIGKSVFFHFSQNVDRLILQIGLSACIFIGPFFYLYLKTIRKEEQVFQKQDLLLIAFLSFSILSIGLCYPYSSYPYLWNAYIVQAIYLVWVFFVGLGIFQSRTLIQKTVASPKASTGTEQYLLAIIIGVVFITSTYQFALYISGFTYIWGALGFSFIFYYLLARVLIGHQPVAPKAASPVLLENGETLLQQINQVMQVQKPYTNPKLKLDQLAELSGLSKHLLSRVLNEVYKNGFSHYINEYRVKEAMQLIHSRDDLSMEGIGYESGFNSKSSFFAAFKKIAHCTPSQYKNSIQVE